MRAFWLRLFQQRTECLVEAAQTMCSWRRRGNKLAIFRDRSLEGATASQDARLEQGQKRLSKLGGTTDWIDNYVQIRPVAPNKCSHLTTSVQKKQRSLLPEHEVE